LTAAGCDGGTVMWSNGGTGTTKEVGSGTYTATCTSTCGVSVNSNAIVISTGTVTGAPIISTNKTSVCGTEKATLTATSCSGGTINWSNGGTAVTTEVGAGTYTATCTTTCGVSVNSNSIVITSGGLPSAPRISTNTLKICAKDSSKIVAEGCTGTITWSNGKTGNEIFVKTVGTYTATCKNTCGTSVASNGIVIDQKTGTECGNVTGCENAPVVTASKTQICEPENITLTATGCPASTTILWSNGKTGTSIIVKPISTSTYSAVCKATNCTSPVSNIVTIKIEKVNKPLVYCVTDLVCLGESVTLRAYDCIGEVKWSNGMTGQSVMVTPTASSKYTALCTLGTCVSEVSDTLCVNIGTPGKPFISCKTSVICLGESAAITAQGCSGTVVWSNGQTGSLLSITPTTAGVYTYSAVCKSTGGKCESVKSNVLDITVGGAVLTPKAIAEITNTCPFGTVDLNNAILGLPSTTNGTFEFHISNSPNSTLITSPGTIGQGEYYLFERSKFGCYSNGTLVKVKIVTGPGCDPVPASFVDIQLKKTANSTNVAVNQFVTYKVVVRNNSTNKATNIVIRDIIPAGLVIDSVSKNARIENGAIFAKFDELKNVDSVTVTYKAKVTSAGKIVNKVELFSVDQVDNVLSNNVSLFTINDFANSELMGLSKALGDVTRVGHNIYEVPYTIYVANLGSVKLNKVRVEDNLDKTFGNGVVILDTKIAVTADSGLVVNPNYTGRGANTNLLADSSSSVPVGKKLAIRFKVKVDVNKATSKQFFNSADATAGNNKAIKDRSTNGTNTDPDGNGNPGDNDEPTPVTFVIDTNKVYIATSLFISDSTITDFNAQVKYTAFIKNTGLTNLIKVSLIDSLQSTYPKGTEFTIVGKPKVSSKSKLKVNDKFNGTTDNRLLLADSTSILEAGKLDTVTFTVSIKRTIKDDTYATNVIAKGESKTGISASDISNTGVKIIAESSTPTIFKLTKGVVGTFIVDKLSIPLGISPGSDGKNDKFEMSIPEGVEIEFFELYNRWGHLVWKFEDGKSNVGSHKIIWDATSNTGLRIGADGVPDGTYFYSVKAKGEPKIKAGFITVAR
jgi:uncharacterized repeat protein (TIGR01451 family)